MAYTLTGYVRRNPSHSSTAPAGVGPSASSGAASSLPVVDQALETADAETNAGWIAARPPADKPEDVRPTLTLPESVDDRLDCVLHGITARDSATGVELRRSRGRRRAGRPARYTVSLSRPGLHQWFHLTAWDDQEAVEKGNARLQRPNPRWSVVRRTQP